MGIHIEVVEAHATDESFVRADCTTCDQEVDWFGTTEIDVPFDMIQRVTNSGKEHEETTGHSVTVYLYERNE